MCVWCMCTCIKGEQEMIENRAKNQDSWVIIIIILINMLFNITL